MMPRVWKVEKKKMSKMLNGVGGLRMQLFANLKIPRLGVNEVCSLKIHTKLFSREF